MDSFLKSSCNFRILQNSLFVDYYLALSKGNLENARLQPKDSCLVTYLNKSLLALEAAASTQSEPIEFPNSTEPSGVNSCAKSKKEEE